MRVLVACEYSGAVRDAFLSLGHDALSCDLLTSESNVSDPSGLLHYVGDVRDLLVPGDWDLMIAFPPCTDLSVSGARWWPAKRADGRQLAAVEFARLLMDAPVPRVAVENPIGFLSTAIRKPDQIIQPWQYGHGETKATCLWLRGLPLLTPTKVVEGREARVHRMPPGPDRAKLRSKTYAGIAAAMAAQWGSGDPSA